MASKPSSSTISWAWALEALASFKEVDASTIKDLFLQGPKISNDVGKDAREMISIRVLESLFDLETVILEPALIPNDDPRFSEHSEDVLVQTIEKMMLPMNTQADIEKLKCDVQTFVAYKRSHLPKLALHKLKDAIVRCKIPSIASLAKRSGLVISNPFETTTHEKNDDFEKSASGVLVVNVNLNPSNNQNLGLKPPEPVNLATEEQLEEQRGPVSEAKRRKLCSKSSQPVEKLSGESHEYMNPSKRRKVRLKPPQPVASGEQTGPVFDKCREELQYVASKKGEFLKCVWEEAAKGCMRCGEAGGKLLVCSSNGCPFVFHDGCLVCVPASARSKPQEFYCPFCRYSRSILDLVAVQTEAMLAKDDLLLAFK